MKIPAVDLRRIHKEVEEELLNSAKHTIASGKYILGEQVQRLEREMARITAVPWAVAVNSGTDALTLAMMASGIGRECEVITTPFSFFAPVEAILAVGAKPVFVDIEPSTFTINPELIERKVTNRTSMILPVHLFGHPADMKKITEQAVMLNNVFVLEDCAQALGARIDGKPVGSFGDFSAFSFYPTKTVGALGDGGCFVSKFENFAEAVKRLRNHGQVRRYSYESRGLNSRMDEMQAGFLNVKLKKLEEWNRQRRELAKFYTRMISEEIGEEVICPIERDGFYHVYHQYTIRVKDRDNIARRLREAGIEAIVHYPEPLHLIKPLRFLGYKPGDFPEAERAANEVLSLPLFPGLEPEEQAFVVSELKKAIRGAKK